MGKIIGKKLSGKYSQKLLDLAKQSATGALKTAPKGEIQKEKNAEVTGDLIGNKITGNITKVSKTEIKIYNSGKKAASY